MRRFRSVDGRWYDGVVEACDGSGVQMRFLKPTKVHMLGAVTVPRQLLKTFRSDDRLPGIQIGSRVLACPRCDTAITEALSSAAAFPTESKAHYKNRKRLELCYQSGWVTIGSSKTY